MNKTTKKTTAKKTVKSVPMYLHKDGKKYLMETVKSSGNLIARGIQFYKGDNAMNFGDSRWTRASRLGYTGSKPMCTIHKFPLSADVTGGNTTLVCSENGVYDVMLIKGKKRGSWDVQVRFTK